MVPPPPQPPPLATLDQPGVPLHPMPAPMPGMQGTPGIPAHAQGYNACGYPVQVQGPPVFPTQSYNQPGMPGQAYNQPRMIAQHYHQPVMPEQSMPQPLPSFLQDEQQLNDLQRSIQVCKM